MSEARTSELILVRIFNGQTATIAKFDRSALSRVSDFFRNLVENPGEGDSEEIALEEEDVYGAAELLMNIVNFYYKKDRGGETAPPVQVWNRWKALMVDKWLVQDYVDAYGALIKQHIEEVILKSGAVQVAGMVSWSIENPGTGLTGERLPYSMNGIYYKTGEIAGGLPIYSRKGLDEYGNQWIMKYCNITWHMAWNITPLKFKGGSHSYGAYVRCEEVLPHLIKEVWQVYDKGSAAPSKHIPQPSVTVSLVPTPLSSADVLLFWEMVGTIFQYVGLMRGPIHSMEDLVDVLSTRKDLRVVEEMKKVLTNDALLLLVDHFP